MSPAGFLALALLTPAAPPAAGGKLHRGDELLYAGTVAETVDRPGTRFKRAHDLEVRVFVLDRGATWADAAVLTLLRRADDAAVSEAVPVVTGTTPDRAAAPPAARLDLVRVHDDGSAHLIVPPGPVPLRLAADTPGRVLPPPPLDTFAPFEFGAFPPRIGNDPAWALASADPARPDEAWQAKGFDVVNGERCPRLVMVQQTADWDRPVGGQTSWQRADSVWISTQDGTARRVHRLIRHRDGIAPTPAVQVEVKYELKSQTRLIGGPYDRYRHEIEVGFTAVADLAPLVRDAARTGPRPFAVRLAKLDTFLAEYTPGTPYRAAVVAARRQLDAARRGEVAPASAVPPTPAVVPAAAKSGAEPVIGQPAPDVRAGGFRLADVRGKPAVLVFFMPGTETADLSLAVADALRTRYAGRIAVAPLAVFAPATEGEKDRDRLKLSIPVYDGAAAGAAYGVETFPRFVVIDAGGVVRFAFAGVGAETGFTVREQVDALLAPAGGAGSPAGTRYPAGAATPRADVPR